MTQTTEPPNAGPRRPAPHYAKTKKRTLTRRGVLWLGQTCNLRCYFCYFLHRIADHEHPEHKFMSVDKAKAICKKMRNFYGNTAIDIQGGEPTIYDGILELCSYCRDIGLHPTLITNAIALARPEQVEKYRDAGVRDFLVSLHGIGEIHDQVVGRTGAYENITKAIGYMCEADMPFRFNCTMSKPVVPQLPQIAAKAIETGAPVVNFIAFNPFEDQQAGIRTHENVPKYTEVIGPLTEALDMLEAEGVEANVRYLPLCLAEERHRKNFYNFQQLSYDHHEWDYQSWLWTGMQPQRMAGGPMTPVYRIGPGDREEVWWPDHIETRTWATEHPIKAKVFFLRQRAKSRIAQMKQGKDALWRNEAQRRASADLHYRYHEACQSCPAQPVCDGFHGDYADLFGTSEATPITDIQPTEDPTVFIKDQEKIVEEEDKHWAL